MEKELKPKGLSFISTGLILIACFFILGPSFPVPSTEINENILVFARCLEVFGIFLVILAYQLYSFKKWAYYGVLVVSAVSLMWFIHLVIRNDSSFSIILFISMPALFFIFTAWYLSKSSVKKFFGISAGR